MKSYKPKQKRGYEAEQNFLQAAKTIFAKEGVARARVSDIVQLAGSSTGNFYFRFKNKEMLFERLFEIYEEHAQRLIQDLQDPLGSLESTIYFVTALNHKLLQENVGLYRAAHEISAKEPETWKRFQQLTIMTAERILELSAPYKDQIPFEDWEMQVRQTVQLITGFTANQAIRNAGPARFGSQAMVDMLFMAAMGSLGLAPPRYFEEEKEKIHKILNDERYS
ncbi:MULTISPECIES: TetR/AcrR family transcriptional regulator [unclassified Pseudovibrio]|uniref:TetR/AcrR family transcriptional regulator n=1 Tax=unclassified Pseudovibrio TaxID=2627060 RepID=UPI0007AE456D|nr:MULTISPECIES: TetR/AcrR family transcriptional regulator [unclassified Pseudovibrio]KZL02504.1 HTH-type transcriptional regulator TtgR [Pseudovibrio sp. W74]KZL07953.1 HTH-type transcriptional regulator TtgR [Pseudovibrio sp. Ad14]